MDSMKCGILPIDSITELDQNKVPARFAQAHKRLSGSYRPLYECIEALKAGFYANSQGERLKSYEWAGRKLEEGCKMSVEAEKALATLVDAEETSPSGPMVHLLRP